MKGSKNTPNKTSGLSRRSFLTKSALAASGFMIVPRHVLGGKGFIAPSDKLNIAGVGVGGRGASILREAAQWNEKNGKARENIVALCDVDEKAAANTFKRYEKAARFKDFRVMLEKMNSDIDAVMVATPDHMHAVVAMAAMQLGKHVYVEKPLTHDVYEARVLTQTARDGGLATQMGNQGRSGDDIRRVCEWIWSGAIGQVREVHAWTNRPVWPQGLPRPKGNTNMPKSLDWDLWLGTAPERDYNDVYVPFGWRGWWDFGTGALGDMACHILDPVFMALKLGYPTSVEATATSFWQQMWQRVDGSDGCPASSIIHFQFPEREDMPPVKVSWYDGGLMPERPEELEDGEQMGAWDGGVLFVGEDGKMTCDAYGRNPRLLPLSRMEEFEEPAPSIPRVQGNHQTSWVEACKGGVPASSNFDYAGPFTEMVLMGNLALRSLELQEKFVDPNTGKETSMYTGRKKLYWEGESMQIINYEPANQFVKREYREGWTLGL